MAASDDRWFTAHPLQVALAIAGLARHGINKLGQEASGKPNTEFHSLNVLPLMTLTKVFWMGSQSQPTLCAQTVLKLHNLQLANLRVWKIDRPLQGLNTFVSTVWSQGTAPLLVFPRPNAQTLGTSVREPRQVFLMLSRNFDNIVGEKDNSQECLGYEIKSWKHVSNVLASDFWKCQVLLSQATTAQVIPRQTWRNGSSCLLPRKQPERRP